MRVDAWDTAFVRARRRDVHAIVRDPRTWGEWWPGARTSPAGAEPGPATRLVLRPPWPARRQVLVVRVVHERPGLGVALAYDGTIIGEAEWFYLDEPAGTVVNYLVRGEVAGRGWRRTLAAHRAAARRGLDALKDGLEAGRRVGDEPDTELLTDQRAARAAFDARVAAARRRDAGAEGSPDG